MHPVTDKNYKNMSPVADKLQNYMSFAADKHNGSLTTVTLFAILTGGDFFFLLLSNNFAYIRFFPYLCRRKGFFVLQITKSTL